MFGKLPKALATTTKYAANMLTIDSIRFMVVVVGVAAIPSFNLSAADSYPPLPETITSFGAVTHDGWLYVFGGHKGKRHDYSAEMVSGSLFRLKLNGGQTWETLPSAPPGQGLALVAHGHCLYRISGMAAQNHEGQNQKLYSLTLVQRFDLRKQQWEDVAPLPTPRSSHDAVVIGDQLYVAGGWDLTGGADEPFWHTNALVLNLAHPQTGWKTFPQPFQRRALALAALGRRVYCIGGMDSDDEPSLAVDIYDTVTGQWSKGPDLPSGKYKGFGCSAIAQHGRIYVTTFKGDLFRLSSDGDSWEVVGRLKQPRITHRLVTVGKKQLIALGGEDGKENKTPSLELLTPAATPLAAKQTATAQTVAYVHP